MDVDVVMKVIDALAREVVGCDVHVGRDPFEIK